LETVKTVVQNYRPEPRLLDLMEQFRQMINLSIAIGLETGITSLKSLSKAGYHRLKVFDTRSKYRLCAISRAAGILKNYRNLSKKHRVKVPYCRRAGLTICYGLKIRNNELILPGGFHILLNNHTLSLLDVPSHRIRSATLTGSRICVSFSKEKRLIDPKGMLGIDRNLNNATAADSHGNILVHDLSKVVIVKSASRRTIARFKRDDVRIRQRIAAKYGRIQRNRTQWLLHNATKKLVEHARKYDLGVALENIKGIRRLYRRGNGQSTYYRGRMNSWPFYEVGRQVSYKASWDGLPTVDVNPKGTTSKCSVCGDRMVFSKESRMLHCPSCSYQVDRDVNAARNILSAGLKFSLLGLSDEAVKGNPTPMVIPGVDDSQSSLPVEAHVEQRKDLTELKHY